MAKKDSLDLVFFMQLALALFFLIQGLQDVIFYTSNNSALESLKNENEALTLITGILSLLLGFLTIISIFISATPRSMGIITTILLIVFSVRVIIDLFFNGMNIENGNLTFSPDFFSWLKQTALEVILFCAILFARKRD